MYCVQKYKYREKMYLDYKYICSFKSVHILDSINKCHYNVFMLQLLCVSNYWQWIWMRNWIALSVTFH